MAFAPGESFPTYGPVGEGGSWGGGGGWGGSIYIFVGVGFGFWNRTGGGVYIWAEGFGVAYVPPGGMVYNRGGGHVSRLDLWGT